MLEKVIFDLKTEKLKDKYKDHNSMMYDLNFGEIEKIKDKVNCITFIGICSALTFIIFISNLGFLLIIPIILVSLLFLLYKAIMDNIIVQDKLKIIYRTGIYIYGYIEHTSSLTEDIEDVIFESESIDSYVKKKLEEFEQLTEKEKQIKRDFVTSIRNNIVLEKRKCFKCQTEIYYSEFYSNNISKIPIQQLEKIWNSPYIQLYCCRCYEIIGLKRWLKEHYKSLIFTIIYYIILISIIIFTEFIFTLIIIVGNIIIYCVICIISKYQKKRKKKKNKRYNYD